MGLSLQVTDPQCLGGGLGDRGKVESREMCKPRNLNIVLMHSQTFKEGKAGRWERPEMLRAMQLGRCQGEQGGQPRE